MFRAEHPEQGLKDPAAGLQKQALGDLRPQPGDRRPVKLNLGLGQRIGRRAGGLLAVDLCNPQPEFAFRDELTATARLVLLAGVAVKTVDFADRLGLGVTVQQQFKKRRTRTPRTHNERNTF